MKLSPRLLKRGCGCTGVLILLLCAGLSSAAAEDYQFIDISNPFLRKIPIAIPVFKAVSPSEAALQQGREAADLLADALVYTGYFKLLPRDAFQADPQELQLVGPGIPYRRWTGIGAELLVTGGIHVDEDLMEMELRLFDTLNQKMLVGKRYKGWIRDRRRMIHRFAGEIVYRLTGSWGIFDTRIAFVSNGTGHKEIYLCDFDGRNVEQLTHSASIVLFPAWSSDGQWLAYTSFEKGHPDLFIRHLREKRGAVVSKEGINSTPAWVPGRFALAATLSFSGDPEIYLLTGAGKIIKKITNNWGIDDSPTWSPDGKEMAFVSNRSGSPQIYVKDVMRNQVRRLTFEGRYNTQPCWSPTGNKIAYTGMVNGQNDIFVISADGSGLRQLTRDAGSNESPGWSADGSLIVFSSTREGVSRIYVMTAFGTDQRRLLALEGEQSCPSWSPKMNVP